MERATDMAHIQRAASSGTRAAAADQRSEADDDASDSSGLTDSDCERELGNPMQVRQESPHDPAGSRRVSQISQGQRCSISTDDGFEPGVLHPQLLKGLQTSSHPRGAGESQPNRRWSYATEDGFGSRRSSHVGGGEDPSPIFADAMLRTKLDSFMALGENIPGHSGGSLHSMHGNASGGIRSPSSQQHCGGASPLSVAPHHGGLLAPVPCTSSAPSGAANCSSMDGQHGGAGSRNKQSNRQRQNQAGGLAAQQQQQQQQRQLQAFQMEQQVAQAQAAQQAAQAAQLAAVAAASNLQNASVTAQLSAQLQALQALQGGSRPSGPAGGYGLGAGIADVASSHVGPYLGEAPPAGLLDSIERFPYSHVPPAPCSQWGGYPGGMYDQRSLWDRPPYPHPGQTAPPAGLMMNPSPEAMYPGPPLDSFSQHRSSGCSQASGTSRGKGSQRGSGASGFEMSTAASFAGSCVGSGDGNRRKSRNSQASGKSSMDMHPDQYLDADQHRSNGSEPRTTLMLRNLPEEYTRDMLTQMLNDEGFKALYDFIYVPMSFRSQLSFGYAFVNFTSPEAIEMCREKFTGFRAWKVPSDKVCEVSWSNMHQGLAAHIERYRNSPVMHESILDLYKPAVFRDGVRLVFPPPTKRIRAPRVRKNQEDGEELDFE